MVTVFHYTPVNAKQFDGLNIDGLAGKHQKYQNFPPSKFCAIRYIVNNLYQFICNPSYSSSFKCIDISHATVIFITEVLHLTTYYIYVQSFYTTIKVN